jgi:hypothetical protein
MSFVKQICICDVELDMDQRILLPMNDISLDVSYGFVVLRSYFPNPVRAYTNFVSVYEIYSFE